MEVPINSIAIEKYNGDLYDLEIEEDHTYTTFHAVVHNSWDNPVDSYLTPFVNQMAVETDPFQAAISGAAMGGLVGGPVGAAAGGVGAGLWSITGGQAMSRMGWVPSHVKKQRQIMAAADIAERDRYRQMYTATGYDEYKYRMRNTIAQTLEMNQPLTTGRIKSIANKPEKAYIQQVINTLNTGNMEQEKRARP
ncbi:MAG: hypothetical protein DRP08_04550 [Candidatus Aenigmatarchaeota archaeon]|nr:MAG: hypothetical protein DRP08_04550 [Candidatus Aenigmarchaeota archaeon]